MSVKNTGLCHVRVKDSTAEEVFAARDRCTSAGLLAVSGIVHTRTMDEYSLMALWFTSTAKLRVGAWRSSGREERDREMKRKTTPRTQTFPHTLDHAEA